MYHNSGTFGMVRSEHNLPRDVNRFQSVGANPSVARGLTPNNPDRSSDGKTKDGGARAKVKSFLDKFAVRRRHANTDAVVPLNDTESTSGVEPFPDFYSVARGNANNEDQTASGGAKNTGKHTHRYDMSDRVFVCWARSVLSKTRYFIVQR